jgi:zinc transport system substrate-binding protein
MRLILKGLTSVLCVASGVAGATGVSSPAAGAPTRGRAPLSVVAAFYPLAWATRAVGGIAVRITDLTPAGAEPHDLEITTDQRDAIEDADLVVEMGDGFQPGVEDAADERSGATLQVLRSIGVNQDEAKHDPHVWLDPVLMGRIVGSVATALTKVDPTRRAVFARRARATHSRLDALNADYQAGLASCARTLLVTSHEAFGWMAKRYGLRQEGIAGIDPEAEPGARRLGELADLARRKGVTTIFTEELVSPKVAQTLAREAGGVKTEVLNPLESLTVRERARGDDYLTVMRSNLAKIRPALACSP